MTNDPFRWLEQDSTKTHKWVSKEREVSEKYFKKFIIRNYLHDRFEGLFKTEATYVPAVRGNKYFYRYKGADEETPSLYVKTGLHGKPKLLINTNKAPKGFGNILTDWSPSRNGRYITAAFSMSGNDKSSIHVFDVEKGVYLKDQIQSDNYPYMNAWYKDEGFWYVRGTSDKKEDEKYYKKLFYHKLGDPISKDKQIFGDGLKKDDWPRISVSRDYKYMIVNVHHVDQTTTAFLHILGESNSGFKKIALSEKGETSTWVSGEFLYMMTDYKAPNRKVLRAKLNGKEYGKWKTFVPERKHNLESIRVMKNWAIIEYIENIKSQVYIMDLKTLKIKKLKLPGIGSIGTISGEYENQEIFYGFSSFNMPSTIFRVNLKTLKTSRYSKEEFSENFDDILIKQEWAKSKDGTKVPFFIVYKKGMKKNSNNPTIVYGYGGFDISVWPHFTSAVIPFIKDGGIYISANIRGGGEFGKKWHEGAKKTKRHKAFEDFAAILKHVSDEHYTNPQKIGIWGGSNGGLLTSVMTQKYPDLFEIALISVPVTDMLRFHLFNGGRWWIDDYGNPDDKKMKKYLLGYSPYHNIKNKNYPKMLFLASEHDDRVHPMHTFKMVAMLRRNKAQKNLILLRIEKKAGHGGANKMTPAIEKFADMFTFVYQELGVKKL